MKIQDVYTSYNIAPNLQRHMLLTAHISTLIIDNWMQPFEQKKELVVACLLHDLGNLIKSDLEKYPEFLGVPSSDIELWEKRQKEMVKKYGEDEHEATKRILKELQVSNRIISMILEKTFANTTKTENSNNWPLKILLYSDLRVGPW